MASTSQGSSIQLCYKSKRCSKNSHHVGKCDSKRVHREFWQKSVVYQIKSQQHKLARDLDNAETKKAEIQLAEQRLEEKQSEVECVVEIAEEKLESAKSDLDKSMEERVKATQQLTKEKQKLNEVTKEYEKLKTFLLPTQQSRTRRENTSTTLDMITNGNSSTRFRRREETKSVLRYIHGGEDGATFGAWDFLSANATKATMEELIGKYRRGRYIEGIIKQTVQEFTQSNNSLSEAISLKYKNFLSRRKFNIICKTQSSVFDTDKDAWVPRNVKCLGVDVQLSLSRVSNESIEKFVKTLDIGCVCQIPDVPGVTRTITGLVLMVIDLHLRLPYLCRQLVWFNGNTNHFLFQFSDDGAPETSQLSMSIGSLTFWNLGERVRSREYQYLLHCVTRLAFLHAKTLVRHS